MKILIFGSSGMVGSSISRLLDKNPNFEVIMSTRSTNDLFNLTSTNNFINEVKPNIIINAAARVGGILSNNLNRFEFILENLKINMNILESCSNKNDIKIINLGSSCIYPLNAKNPLKEDYIMSGKLEPTNSPYAMAKLAAIEMGDSLRIEYGHKVINLMPTNLYGPNDNFSENESHVIPGLIYRMHQAKIKNQKVFKIWGTGKPLREFLYVDDLSEAIKLVIDKNIDENLLNIGSGHEISIFDLSILIKEVTKFNGDLIFDSSKPDGNPRKLLDTTKISSYGWKPKTNLIEGLQKTYKWFLKNL